MAKNRLVNKHIFGGYVHGCIQVRSSLYACFERDLNDKNLLWSSFTDFNKETVKEKALKEPFFTKRNKFSLSNFSDQIIFFIGGFFPERFSEVFYYKIQTDEWIRAPALNQARYGHSSCIIGNSLYVYGGTTSDGYMLPIERLKNVNSATDNSPIFWEMIRIDTEIPTY